MSSQSYRTSLRKHKSRDTGIQNFKMEAAEGYTRPGALLQRRQRRPTPGLLPGKSQGRGAWRAAVHAVAQRRTGLKRLSSSSRRPSQPWGFSEWGASEHTVLRNGPTGHVPEKLALRGLWWRPGCSCTTGRL